MTQTITVNRPINLPIKVHVLIDLEWSPSAGGHVKCWERFASAAAGIEELDLTLHFAGSTGEMRQLSPNVRMRLHRPVFSTRLIPFLGPVPDHSDLASYHLDLARHLTGADVIHTTDAFFAYACTAERVCRETGAALTHSMHTDTIAYTELFTRAMIGRSLGDTFSRILDEQLKLPQRAAESMAAKLKRHQKLACFTLVSRAEDRARAVRNAGEARVRNLRLGVDFDQFNPARTDRAGIAAAYSIPPDGFIVAFAGRLDEGKNITVLIDAMEQLLRAGFPLFLVAAGSGPAQAEIEKRFGHAAVCPGILEPEALSRLYASADILALPSKVETWSMVTAEALASGLPVVAAGMSGVGRFLSGAGAGAVVAEDTPQAWAEALQKAQSTLTTATAKKAALAAAKEHFPSWRQALVEDLLPVWREAANKGFEVSGLRGFEENKTTHPRNSVPSQPPSEAA